MQTSEKQQRFLRRAAFSAAGLILGVLVIYLVAVLLSGQFSVISVRTVNTAVYSTIAVLILRRHPRHMVGWLFLIVGFFSMLSQINGEVLHEYAGARVEQIGVWLNWLESLSWQPWTMIPISLVLLYFPDGRLPSARWRPVAAAAVIGITGIMTSHALHPWPWDEQGLTGINPAAIPGSETLFEGFFMVAAGFFLVGLVGAVASVWVRFRVAHGLVRNQMKWLFYPAVIGISSLLLGWLIVGFENPVTNQIYLSFPTLFASMIGIAILRHQLFDIDIIIRRTLQYAILTGFVVLIYYGGVVVFQAAVGALSEADDSPLVTVITTLLIAALFNPLRRRVQDFVDRRFYRSRYDAEKALARFALAARDEVDVDRFASELLHTVQETIQPVRSSLWLKER